MIELVEAINCRFINGRRFKAICVFISNLDGLQIDQMHAARSIVSADFFNINMYTPINDY